MHCIMEKKHFLDNLLFDFFSVSINESNEMWIGAWWIGALISGIFALLASIPVLMLPRVIPGTEKHRIDREKEIHNSAREDGENEDFGKK